MSGMGFMIAAASRKRDDRGRYAEGDTRMGNDHGTYMGDDPEMRRRRDDRGRYMEGDMAYRPWPEPHIPPYSKPESRMEGGRMRDRNVINIRDYMDRRQIGFVPRMDEEDDRDMRQYGRRYDPDRPAMHHGEERNAEHRTGMAEASGSGLTREEAEKWVRGMKSEDGKTGARWELRDVQKYAGNYGIEDDEVIDFFAVLNALASDYGKVAKKYGVDRMEFWAEMAKAFMHDTDAVPDKVRMYYECIAKKDE